MIKVAVVRFFIYVLKMSIKMTSNQLTIIAFNSLVFFTALVSSYQNMMIAPPSDVAFSVFLYKFCDTCLFLLNDK